MTSKWLILNFLSEFCHFSHFNDKRQANITFKWQKSDKIEEPANVNFISFVWVSGLYWNKLRAALLRKIYIKLFLWSLPLVLSCVYLCTNCVSGLSGFREPVSKTTPINHSYGKIQNTAYTYETDILCALNFALELTCRAFLLEVARTTNKLLQTPKVAQKLPSTIETGPVIMVSPITILSDRKQTVKFRDCPTTIRWPYPILTNNDTETVISDRPEMGLNSAEQKSLNGPHMTVQKAVFQWARLLSCIHFGSESNNLYVWYY